MKNILTDHLKTSTFYKTTTRFLKLLDFWTYAVIFRRMNKLATVQQVKNVRLHPNADALDLVQILGWQVVTKRNEFKENDLCVYVAIDNVLPDKPEFQFLKNKNFRIKPIKLRKMESAGIVFPLSILPGYEYDIAYNGPVCSDPTGARLYLECGTDVTDVIGVTHYEKPIPAELAGQALGGMPGFIIITDELNLRTYPNALPELYGRPYYITRKDDGSSGTFFIKGGEFGVCSRRINLKENETNGFWRMARKYDIENVLRKAFPDTDIAIQGEVVGPGIQKNNLGLKELDLHIFNIFDIVNRYYLDYDKLVEFTNTNNIPMVTTINQGSAFGYNLEELLELANSQVYPTGKPAEGIVIRPKESFRSIELGKHWSGKVLNENYED